jgi:hypothetical protein
MAMAVLNPISHPDPAVLTAVLGLDPTLQAEERLQSLLYLWLGKYFSGVAFQTLDEDGEAEGKTFTKCLFDFQEGVLPENAQHPQIHLVMPDRKATRRDYVTQRTGHEDDWTIDALIKVPATITKTQMPGSSAEEIARRVGDELTWLLGSTEREALGLVGITRVKVERPSTILAGAGPWQMRLVVFCCRTRREQARRSF